MKWDVTKLDYLRKKLEEVQTSIIITEIAFLKLTTILLPANLISQFEVATPLVVENCSTVEEALKEVIDRYPGVNEYLYSDSGSLRRFLNLFVDGEDVRFLEGTKTTLNGVNELSILMAVAGG